MNKVRVVGLILFIVGLIVELTIGEGLIGIISSISMGIGFPLLLIGQIKKTSLGF